MTPDSARGASCNLDLGYGTVRSQGAGRADPATEVRTMEVQASATVCPRRNFMVYFSVGVVCYGSFMGSVSLLLCVVVRRSLMR